MPIYEYRCSSCGHKLEALQKLSDAPLSKCPSCNADALVKLVSAAGFQLKGSGWYATDFKGSGAKPAATKGGGGRQARGERSGREVERRQGRIQGRDQVGNQDRNRGRRHRSGLGNRGAPCHHLTSRSRRVR